MGSDEKIFGSRSFWADPVQRGPWIRTSSRICLPSGLPTKSISSILFIDGVMQNISTEAWNQFFLYEPRSYLSADSQGTNKLWRDISRGGISNWVTIITKDLILFRHLKINKVPPFDLNYITLLIGINKKITRIKFRKQFWNKPETRRYFLKVLLLLTGNNRTMFLFRMIFVLTFLHLSREMDCSNNIKEVFVRQKMHSQTARLWESQLFFLFFSHEKD